MSSLHLFTQRKWFRRLWLIALGLILGYGYAFNYLDDIVLVPAGLGFIIGLLSQSLLAALINTVIVLISYVAGLLIFIVAGNLGSGAPFVLEFYQDRAADAFMLSVLPLYTWFPNMLVGLVVRFLMLKLLALKAARKS